MRKKSHKEKNVIDSGRIAQKMKTRKRLLIAAHSMILEGEGVNIENVAKRAGMSKATAYRYFSSKDVLRKEAALHFKSQVKENLFSDLGEADLKGRLEKLIQYHFDLLTNNEVEFRLFLSAVMQESVQNKKNHTRAGRRILLIEEALISLKNTMPKDEFDRIVSAISIILGIESITVLKDLCHLENESIIETWKWMIDKIVLPLD